MNNWEIYLALTGIALILYLLIRYCGRFLLELIGSVFENIDDFTD